MDMKTEFKGSYEQTLKLYDGLATAQITGEIEIQETVKIRK